MHGALIRLCVGPRARIFEMFLEPTCPFSVKAFGKLDDLLDQAGEERITIKVGLQSQPWHMYSGVIVRCILAASTLEGGKTAAKSVMAAVGAHRKEFEFDRHCSGPNLDATPADIIRRIEQDRVLTITLVQQLLKAVQDKPEIVSLIGRLVAQTVVSTGGQGAGLDSVAAIHGALINNSSGATPASVGPSSKK
jgi:hypothetical protein